MKTPQKSQHVWDSEHTVVKLKSSQHQLAINFQRMQSCHNSGHNGVVRVIKNAHCFVGCQRSTVGSPAFRSHENLVSRFVIIEAPLNHLSLLEAVKKFTVSLPFSGNFCRANLTSDMDHNSRISRTSWTSQTSWRSQIWLVRLVQLDRLVQLVDWPDKPE